MWNSLRYPYYLKENLIFSHHIPLQNSFIRKHRAIYFSNTFAAIFLTSFSLFNNSHFMSRYTSTYLHQIKYMWNKHQATQYRAHFSLDFSWFTCTNKLMSNHVALYGNNAVFATFCYFSTFCRICTNIKHAQLSCFIYHFYNIFGLKAFLITTSKKKRHLLPHTYCTMFTDSETNRIFCIILRFKNSSLGLWWHNVIFSSCIVPQMQLGYAICICNTQIQSKIPFD